MSSSVTRVSGGVLVGKAKGRARGFQRKHYAVLEELKKLQPLPTVEQVKPEPKRKQTHSQATKHPEYGQGMNPISRLAQTQQAKRGGARVPAPH